MAVVRKGFKYDRMKEIHGQIGKLHAELSDLIATCDKATAAHAAAQDNHVDPKAGRKPVGGAPNPAAKNSVQSMDAGIPGYRRLRG